VTTPPPSPGPRIICSTASLFSWPLQEVFPLLADAGFGGVEIMVTKDPDTQDHRRLCELAEDHGLEIVAVHAPFLLMTRAVWGTDPVGKITLAVELAEKVGASLVVVHPPYRWQSKYRAWLTDGLPALSVRTDVRIAVENMFPVRVRGRRVGTFHAVSTIEQLEGFDHVVLDTSHAAVAGLDLVESLETLRHRLRHVHLSDNAGKGWDSHLPIGEGVLPLDGFLAALVAARYTESISLEIDLRRHLKDPAAVRGVLVENREFCTARLQLAE
jgi:sugar phosphate isomerase/epimerase